jgi:NAD(P)H-quinone oxidoreductase subunit 5
MTTIGIALAIGIIALPLISGGLAFAAGDRLAGSSLKLNIRLLWAAVALAGVALVLTITGTLPAAGGAAGMDAPGALVGIDALGALMALAVGLVSALVHSFSRRYMQTDPALGAFCGWLGVITAAVIAVVLAQNLVVLALAWLLTGYALVRLIGHRRDWPAARASSRRTFATFAIGDAALIAGLVLLAAAAGTTSLPAISAAAGTLAAQSWSIAGIELPLFAIALCLIVIAAMARSAIFPLHQWLLGSMNAPTPVSALMHAGLVNAGGILLARFAHLYAEVPAVLTGIFVLGAVTAFLGTALMLVQSDVKRMLGCSTMGQMGFMLMQCGLGAFAAAIYHLVAHGLFKATLFLGAGSALEGPKAGQHDDRAAPGLIALPLLAAAGLVGAGAFALISGKTELGTAATGILLTFAFLAAMQAGAAALASGGIRIGALAPAMAAIVAAAVIYAAGLTAVEAMLAGTVAAPAIAFGWIHGLVAAAFAASFLVGLAGHLRPAGRAGAGAGSISRLSDAAYVRLLNASTTQAGDDLTLVRNPA